MTDHSGPTRQPDETAPGEGGAEPATAAAATGTDSPRDSGTGSGKTAGRTATAGVGAVGALGGQTGTQKSTVYRGVASLVGGILVAVLCLAGILDLLIESGSQDLIGVAVLILIIALAIAYGIYPAAYSGDDGVLVRNPFRTIKLPWSAVTDINARLSFIVHTEKKHYTIWAIPVSLHDRRKIERERLKELSRTNRPARARSRRLPDMPLPANAPRTDPIDRLSYADQALREMRERQDTYETRVKAAALLNSAADGKPASPESTAPATVDVRWTWPMPLVIGVAALFVLIVAIVK